MATARLVRGLVRVRAVETFRRNRELVNVGDSLLVDHAEARRLIAAGLARRDPSDENPLGRWPMRLHTR